MNKSKNDKLPSTVAGDPRKPLIIGNAKLLAYVLDDENNTRVLSLRSVQASIGMRRNIGVARMVDFARFLGRKGIENKDLAASLSSPIEFRPPRGGRTAFGYPATVLADLCEAILAARDADALTKRQLRYADHAEVLLRSFAKVGIVALVDEATGYELERDKGALAKLLDLYLTDERRRWTRTFPYEFYQQIFRLLGWEGPDGHNFPPVVGKWTNEIVYDRLAPGLLEELQKRNPKQRSGSRRYRHHQWFNIESGHPQGGLVHPDNLSETKELGPILDIRAGKE